MQKLLVIIIYIIFCLPSFGSEMDENSESEVDKSFFQSLDDITWGEAMNIVLTKKFPTFFSDYGDMQ